MDCWKVWSAITLWTVFFVNGKETTKEINCCNLPFRIPLNRSLNHEFTIANKSVAIAEGSTFNASAPFTVHGNTALDLHSCLDFNQATIFKNELGFIEEETINYQSHPCNNTGHANTGHANTGVIVIVVLVVVAGVIAIAVFLFKKTSFCKKTEAGDNVV